MPEPYICDHPSNLRLQNLRGFRNHQIRVIRVIRGHLLFPLSPSRSTPRARRAPAASWRRRRVVRHNTSASWSFGTHPQDRSRRRRYASSDFPWFVGAEAARIHQRAGPPPRAGVRRRQARRQVMPRSARPTLASNSSARLCAAASSRPRMRRSHEQFAAHRLGE